jgi:hypothetical protein
VRVPYKVLPLDKPHPAFAHEKTMWVPVLSVRLSYRHSRQTPRVEAVVDSGASHTLFRADIADYIGIKLEDGIKSETTGIVPGAKIDVYFHGIRLFVGVDGIAIRAGFAKEMAVGAILGRSGFFEHFSVLFDPSAKSPGLEIERIYRA